MAQHPCDRMRWARWNRAGLTLPDPFVLCQTPSGFTRWRAPVCRQGCHLPNQRKDKLWAQSVCEEKYRRTPAGGRRRSKEPKCKYSRRSVPLHHCWLWLILWASANNGGGDCFVTEKKESRKSRQHCYLCCCCVTSKWAQCSLCTLSTLSVGECAMHCFCIVGCLLAQGLNRKAIKSDFEILSPFTLSDPNRG